MGETLLISCGEAPEHPKTALEKAPATTNKRKIPAHSKAVPRHIYIYLYKFLFDTTFFVYIYINIYYTC